MKEDNDNKKNNTDESPKSHSDNTQVNESDKDLEKKALIDLLEERIRASKIDSNIDNDEEDDEEPETDDDEEHLLDDDEIAEMIDASIDDMDDDDFDEILSYQDHNINMDVEDYHNESCMLAKRSHVEKAADCAIAGLKKFKFNPTLMADVIKYCTEAGDMIRAARYYSMLKEKVDLCRWDWRAFTYSFDFLLASDHSKTNVKEMRVLLKKYKDFFPHDEKPYFLTAQLEEYLGNKNNDIKALEEAIQKLPNACQCALKLADEKLEHDPEQAIRICNYGIAAAAMSSQPAINTSYLALLRTLAKDHLLHRKAYNGEEVSEAELRSVEEDYKRLLTKFKKELHHYYDMMEVRLKLLLFINTNF